MLASDGGCQAAVAELCDRIKRQWPRTDGAQIKRRSERAEGRETRHTPAGSGQKKGEVAAGVGEGPISLGWTRIPVFDVVREAIGLENATKKVSIGGGGVTEEEREGVVGAGKASLV